MPDVEPWRFRSHDLAALLLLSCATLAPAHAAPASDPVIAARGRDLITLREARAYIATLDVQTRAGLTHDPSALTPILRDLLLRRAILTEAALRHWADRPEVAALLARAREQVLAETFLSAQAMPAPGFPTDADLRTAYDQNRQRLLLPRRYHLAQIYLQAGPATQDAARQRLAGLKAAGASGLAASAEKAGLRYADLGWVAENDLASEVRQAVAGLPEGEISNPMCMVSGCSLILLIATKPSGLAGFDDAHDTLVRALRQQKRQADEQAYEDKLLAREPVRINQMEYPAILGIDAGRSSEAVPASPKAPAPIARRHND